MRTVTAGRLLVPLICFSAACGERSGITASEDDLIESVDSGFAGYRAVAVGGGNGTVAAINSAGIAVGHAREGGGSDPYPALRWTVTHDDVQGPEILGSMPPPFHNTFSLQPVAINSRGDVVGHFIMYNVGRRAFVRTADGVMQPLQWFQDRTHESFAVDINDAGVIVGYMYFDRPDGVITAALPPRSGVVWRDHAAEPVVLPPLDGHAWTLAFAIGDDGVVVGTSIAENHSSVGVAWQVDDDGSLIGGPVELAAAFGPITRNRIGDVAGWLGEPCRAGFYRDGRLVALDPLDATGCTRPTAISNPAPDGTVHIVGFSGNLAALWTVDPDGQVGETIDLGHAEGHNGAYASGINDRGVIVGAGRTGRGDRPVIWLPR